MIFLDNKQVKIHETALYQQKKKEFESFIAGKEYVQFSSTEPKRINVTGLAEPDKKYTIPVEVVLSSEDGYESNTWLYAVSAPKRKQNGDYDFDKGAMIVDHDFVVRTTEKDKIFFLIYVSTALRNGRFKVVDEDKEARDRVAKIGKTVNVDFFLTSEMSPISEKTIRRIAQAFGVGDVDKKTKDKVVLELRSIITTATINNEPTRNEDAFLEALNKDEETNNRAIVQEAFDMNRIGYNETGRYFHYKTSEGIESRIIMRVDPMISEDNIKRTNALVNYFTSSPDRLKELYINTNYETEDLNIYDFRYASVKAFASKHGCDARGSKDELFERVQKFYDDNKTTIKFDVSFLERETVKAE